MRQTPEVIRNAEKYQNPMKEREINLRGLKAAVIENLSVTNDEFNSIDLCDNEILKLDGIPPLKNLRSLMLANNRILKISPHILPNLLNLASLVLSNNMISNIEEVRHLALLPSLTHVYLLKNPIAASPNYRILIAHLLPRIQYLDGTFISAVEREKVKYQEKMLKEGKSYDALLMQPLESLTIAKVMKQLTEEQTAKLLEMIENAEAIEELEKLEEILTTGIIPTGFTFQ